MSDTESISKRDNKTVEYTHVRTRDQELVKRKVTDWIENDCWPVPEWLKKDSPNIRFANYDAYLRYNLRTRYLALEGDTRMVLNNHHATDDFDKITAVRICCLLQTAREALENTQVNLLTISNTLDIIEQNMIWLCPKYIVKMKMETLANKLAKVRPVYSAMLTTALKSCDNDPEIRPMRALYDEITADINRETTKVHINYGLQISRLQLLRNLSFVTFVVTIFIAPLLVNYSNSSIEDYKVAFLRNFGEYLEKPIKGWLLIGMLATFGCLGGFISGMLQIKSTSTNLQRYKESLLKFQLKPLIGGITAALVSILLSWDLLPGIEIKSLGSFIIIAFLTGFSERYFLKLVNMEEQKDDAKLAEKATEIQSSSPEMRAAPVKEQKEAVA